MFAKQTQHIDLDKLDSAGLGCLVVPSDTYGLFGRRVSEERAARGVSQEDLARRVGLSRASIANIEAGRQRVLLHQALALAEALNVRSLSDLFSIDLRADEDGTPTTQPSFSGSSLTAEEAKRLSRLVARA